MRLIAYTRATDASGHDIQTRIIDQWAMSHGHEIIRREKGDGLNRAIASVPREADAIVAVQRDRLARTIRGYLDLAVPDETFVFVRGGHIDRDMLALMATLEDACD